jgi:hypothetical protein
MAQNVSPSIELEPPVQVRGPTVAGLVSWVRETYGEALFQRVVSQLPQKSQGLFQRNVLSLGWYPLPLCERLMFLCRAEVYAEKRGARRSCASSSTTRSHGLTRRPGRGFPGDEEDPTPGAANRAPGLPRFPLHATLRGWLSFMRSCWAERRFLLTSRSESANKCSPEHKGGSLVYRNAHPQIPCWSRFHAG